VLRALLGSRGERLAAHHFRRAGFKIIARNYRALDGEIDLIATDGRLLLFVEVKTRQRHADRLAHSVPPAKQRHIIRAARSFIQTRNMTHLYGRFDVILIDASSAPPKLQWIEAAFELD